MQSTLSSLLSSSICPTSTEQRKCLREWEKYDAYQYVSLLYINIYGKTTTATAVKIRFSTIVESLFSITLGTHKDSSQIVQHTYSLAHTQSPTRISDRGKKDREWMLRINLSSFWCSIKKEVNDVFEALNWCKKMLSFSVLVCKYASKS